MNTFKRIAGVFTVLCFLAAASFAQTKSYGEVQAEISAFETPAFYTASYENDLTTVKLFFDLREDNPGLQKPFKEFSFEISSIYSGPAVDGKPVRSLVCISTRAKKFYFSSNRELTIFVDSAPLRFGEGERSTELRKGKTREKLCWAMDDEALEELVEAGAVSFQVGSQTVSIPSEKSRLFDGYAALLKTKDK